MENFEDIKNKYLELVEFLSKYFPNKKSSLTVDKYTDEVIKEYVLKFVNGVNQKSKYQNMLVERNVNLFHKTGHPNYIPFLLELNIKKFLLVEDKYIQHIIWENLQIIYLLAEQNNKQKWHELLLFKIENTECPPVSTLPDDKKQEAIDNMVGDITDIFKNLGDNKGENKMGDMMGNLMKTATNIAQKYSGELQGEDLDIGKVIKSVSKAFGQDENEMNKMINENPMFQSLLKGGKPEDMLANMKDVLGVDPMEMLKNPDASQLGSLLGGLGGLGGAEGKPDMMGSLLSGAMGMMTGKKDETNTSELTEEQMKEMEEFFKNNTEAFEQFLAQNEKK